MDPMGYSSWHFMFKTLMSANDYLATTTSFAGPLKSFHQKSPPHDHEFPPSTSPLISYQNPHEIPIKSPISREHSQLIRWKSPVVPQADRSHRRLDLLAFADRSLPAEPSGVPVVRRGRNRKADGHNCGLIFWRVRARNDMNSYDWTIDLSDL